AAFALWTSRDDPGPKIGIAARPAEGDPGSTDALTQAWKRVVERPKDAALWMALGDLQAAHEQVDSAEHSYRTAVRLSSAGGADGYARLGFLLYGRGDDAGALTFLLEAKRRGAKDAMLDFTLSAIRER